jgi:hypothetical protein
LNGEPAVAMTDASTSSERPPPKPSEAELFAILWTELSDMLGTAAAAILLKRALRRALPRRPELAELQIARDAIDHHYVVPASWAEARTGTPDALRELGQELSSLLVALTGKVVVNRLVAVNELRANGVFPKQEES